MNALERWQAANNRYLASALADLRARLERLATAQEVPSTSSATPTLSSSRPLEASGAGVATRGSGSDPAPEASWLRRLIKPRRNASAATGGPDTSIATRDASDADPLAKPAADATVAGSDTPALTLLSQRLGLSEFERQTLLLCAAMEFDTRTGALCARAQGDAGKPYPTFGLAMALFDEPAWDALSPERPLRYWRLLEINQPGTQPLIAAALKVDERIVNYLKGANYLDDRLAPLVSFVPAGADDLPPSHQHIAAALMRRLNAAAASGSLPVVQLLGTDGASKSLIARHVATELGLGLYRMTADAVPTAIPDQDTFQRLWQRESALLPLALHIDAVDADRVGAHGAAIQRLLGRLGGVVMLDVREPWPSLGRDSLPVDVAKPTSAEQKATWIEALGADAAAHAERPATHFNFGVSTIRRLAADALVATANDRAGLAEVLWANCLGRARPTLDQLAQLVDAKARWDDLQLPVAEKAQLRQIADQVEQRRTVYDDWGFRERMNRGLGISVLFAGESGTGKTMAAEVIANELGLLLYRIDLSAVVNKYIGETEKNLRRLFDAAEDGGAILLFDEADALFGKRSEVKDSHDRYSNIEVNYLLQRMEAFRGLAILATNMKSALDSAFLRRLRFIVKFPFPGQAERKAIWQKALPSGVETGALDFDRLARLNLSGGSIHSIALNAAFLAARAGMPVTMQMMLDAARSEFRKLEKPVNESEFRWLDSIAGSA